ncbi:MAG: hypothetical protein JXO72_03310 [Vicinamibacteria bacterium]|nr:hypothetical protein [Vicinamibacteria bacterium]
MTKTLATSVVILTLSVAAWAGRVDHAETEVDLVQLQASGSFFGTRHSADDVQYIGCMVGMSWDSHGDYLHASCYAQETKRKGGEYLVCYTRDPALVDAILSTTANSHVRFKCEPVPYWEGSTLVEVSVRNASYLTGPMP